MQIYDKIFIKKDNETEQEYKIRCFQEKNNFGVTWQDLADILNCQLKKNYSPDAYRKQYTRYKKTLEDLDQEDYVNDLNELLMEMKKERVKLSDERTQNNSYIRKLAREETLKEIALEYAKVMEKKPLLYEPVILDDKYTSPDKNREAILLLSDWHYGIDVNNYINTYNPSICKSRVSELLEKVYNIIVKEKISKLHVVNLSDLICGRIHMGLRLQSRIDVITQTMDVAEILAEFLSYLSKITKIEYRDVLDNHSRLEPNKAESLELESLVRIIPWYLKERLKKDSNICFPDNYNDDDILAFQVCGNNIAAVHGHKDKPTKVIDNMIVMTGRLNDLVLTAHLHHFSAEEEHECVRISNGSLMGTDDYAKDLRLTSKPSQTMIICTSKNVTECIYKINLE